MTELIPILRKEEIERSVGDMARQISLDYAHRKLVLVGVLKGAFIFLSDLARKLTIPAEIDFLCLSSYGDGTSSSGNVQLIKDIDIDICGKDVLIIEDIVDTGVTLRWLIEYFQARDPSSVRICALIDKKERREVPVDIDYVCHEIGEGFLVGYGLDFAEQYRHLPEIFHLKQ
jgi:hypoxanthine phosphoribosyltransferase